MCLSVLDRRVVVDMSKLFSVFNINVF
jgi:hypothetical protein